MEIVLHTMYVVAIKDAAAWAGDSAAELSMIGFWNLVVVWLKVRNLASPTYMLIATKAPDPLAILPTMGTRRRHGPTREHD